MTRLAITLTAVAGLAIGFAREAQAQDASPLPSDPALSEPRRGLEGGEFASEIASRRSLEDLDLGPERLARIRSSRIDVDLVTRADQVLLRGALHLRFAPDRLPEEVTGLRIELNGEPLAELDRRDLLDGDTARTADLDPRMVSGRDSLGLVLETADPCARVEPGTWSFIAEGRLETLGTPLTLPNALELLPLPFADDTFESRPELTFVIPEAESELLEAAAVVAAGMSARTEGLLQIRVKSSLPEGYAIAFVANPEDAGRLGLPYHRRPTAEIVDRPPRPNAKVLVFSGGSPREVKRAAVGLFDEGGRGARAEYDGSPPAPRRAPPKRWLRTRGPLTLDAIAGGELVHRGLRPATLRTQFRVAPDLFGWPEPTFPMVVRYRRRAELDAPRALIDVEFNGIHVTSLNVEDRSGTSEETRLWIPRETLRGFNELVFHVRHEGIDACLEDDGIGEGEIVIEGSTQLDLADFRTFAALPNLELFAFDGFPYTRYGSLAETVALLPPKPATEELASFLSVMARMGAVTGELPVGLRVRMDPKPPRQLDADLLVIGAYDRHPVLKAWRTHAPIAYGRLRALPRIPDLGLGLGLREALEWFDRGDLGRARELSRAHADVAALFGFPSPVAPNRSVVAITAASPEQLPNLSVFTGFAQASRRGGDLMLYSAEADVLTRHQLGFTRDEGEIEAWTRLRWFIARRWGLLVPLLAAAVWFGAGSLNPSLERRLRQRVRGAFA